MAAGASSGGATAADQKAWLPVRVCVLVFRYVRIRVFFKVFDVSNYVNTRFLMYVLLWFWSRSSADKKSHRRDVHIMFSCLSHHRML